MPPSTSFIGFLPTQILKDKLIWVTGMYSFDDRILFLLCTPIVSSQLVAGTHISIGGQTKKSIYLLCTPSTKELLHPGLQSKWLPYTDILNLPTVSEFLFDVCASHFSKIAEDPSHPLFNRVIFNTFRTSSRGAARFYPGKCHSETYRNRFFQFFMSHFNMM